MNYQSYSIIELLTDNISDELYEYMKELNKMNDKSLSDYKSLIINNLQSLNLKNYESDDSNAIL